MEGIKTELRQTRDKVVEDVRGQSLVVRPVRVVGETVYLQGQTLRPRLELPDQKCHLLVDLRMSSQIMPYIRPERAHIREPSGVRLDTFPGHLSGVSNLQVFLLCAQVFVQELEAGQASKLVFG